MSRYLDDPQQGALKNRLYAYLSDRAKRREDTTSSKTYEGLEDAIMKQKEFSELGALAGGLGDAAGQIGTIDGKSAKSGIPAFVDRMNGAGQQALSNYRGVRDMEERANMNDLGVANYLTALDTKDETNKYREKVFDSNEKTAQLRRRQLQAQLDAKRNPKMTLNDDIQGPGGEPVLLGEDGTPKTLPGYKLRERPASMAGTGSWSTSYDGAGNPVQTNSKTGDMKLPKLPLGFTPKTPATPHDPAQKAMQSNAADLEKSAVKSTTVANMIEAQIGGVERALQSGDKATAIANANEMLKTLNSPMGADAIGAEERQRLGYLLENLRLNLFNDSNVLKNGLGPDIPGFIKAARSSANNIRNAARMSAEQAKKLRGGGALEDTLGGQKSGSFPRTVTNANGEEATVSNEQELKEAQAEGFN